MADERAKVRLYVEADLGPGLTVGATPRQAHYLKHVMRLGPGDALRLFNGRDGEWLARIDGLGRGWGSLSLEKRRRPQAEGPDLWLVFSPIKRARLDFLAEKATELGCSALQPMWTQRTDVGRVNVERLAANAREAAEQCERLSVPTVAEPLDLARLLAAWPSERRALLCAEAGEARPIAEALAAIGEETGGRAGGAPWAVITGPEGGFRRSELDALAKLPFVTPVGLGPRVLRSDTAALAALACWQAWLGDAGERPPFRAGA